MTLIEDQIQRLDAQLDNVQLDSVDHENLEQTIGASEARSERSSGHAPSDRLSSRATLLRRAVKTLSSTSSSQPILSRWRIDLTLRDVFDDPSQSPITQDGATQADGADLEQLEWLLIGKAAIQVHGLVLNKLIDQTLPLSDGLWYWNEIRGSYRYAALYTVQTLPIRLRAWSQEIYSDARQKFDKLLSDDDHVQSVGEREQNPSFRQSLLGNWQQFYDLVRESIRERSVSSVQRQALSPISICRAEARSKQAALRNLREKNASALGILVDEAFTFEIDDNNGNRKSRDRNGSAVMAQQEWKEIVEKSISLLESVLKNVGDENTTVSGLDDTVFAAVEADPDLADQDRGGRPAKLATKLQAILDDHLPKQMVQFEEAATRNGIPSRLIRYWLPATVLLISSSTVLRILTSRRAAIVTWFRELGQTVIDFWANWIVQPAKKIIQTIRHDEGSEVALMSKRSLQGDRDSLERMVVDFAVDNPEYASENGSSSTLDQTTVEAIRAGIKEGDLTPVLRAYEKDIKRPLRGAVAGNLARALLIQVQKTKVDVEVAISGIDSLLKSQELVFGFVGLTPSIIICLGVSRWLASTFGSRKGARSGSQRGRVVRTLRHIDKILTSAMPSATGMLSYKEHGLLLCEVHELRKLAAQIMPGPVMREFLEELEDLVELRTGVEKQRMVVKRVRWGFSRYIS